MEVGRPPDEANRIIDGDGVVLPKVRFGQDEVADEPTSVTDIESARPAAVVRELILGQSPGAPSLARGLRDRGVIAQIPIQALDVVARSADHLRPFGVARGWVAVIEAGEVAGERVPGAGVRLAVGHPDAGGVDLAARGEVTALEFVMGRVVVGRLLDRGTVGGPGQAKAEAVTLDTVVGVAVLTRRGGLDAVDEAAGGVTRTDVGVDALVELLVFAVELQAVGRLAIHHVAFAADGETQAREGQQVAFVGGIDEDLALDDRAVLAGD